MNTKYYPPALRRVLWMCLVALQLCCLVMLWVAGCIALRCTVAPGRVVCHAWFVFWVRHVLSSRVVLQHVTPTNVLPTNVFCARLWYEAGLRSCHFMWGHVVSSIMSRHVTSRHVTSRHVTSRHVTSCPAISARVMFGSSSGILLGLSSLVIVVSHAMTK